MPLTTEQNAALTASANAVRRKFNEPTIEERDRRAESESARESNDRHFRKVRRANQVANVIKQQKHERKARKTARKQDDVAHEKAKKAKQEATQPKLKEKIAAGFRALRLSIKLFSLRLAYQRALKIKDSSGLKAANAKSKLLDAYNKLAEAFVNAHRVLRFTVKKAKAVLDAAERKANQSQVQVQVPVAVPAPEAVAGDGAAAVSATGASTANMATALNDGDSTTAAQQVAAAFVSGLFESVINSEASNDAKDSVAGAAPAPAPAAGVRGTGANNVKGVTRAGADQADTDIARGDSSSALSA